MITTFIYLVAESETKTVLYVGKTKWPISRMKDHVIDFRSRFGCEIDMILVDHIDHEDESGWEQLEIDWISLFKNVHSIFILNKQEGGHDFGFNGSSFGAKVANSNRKGSLSHRKGKKLGPNGRKGIPLGKQSTPRSSSHISKIIETKRKNGTLGIGGKNSVQANKLITQEKYAIMKETNCSWKEAGIIRWQRKGKA